jgi:hypothetical protein
MARKAIEKNLRKTRRAQHLDEMPVMNERVSRRSTGSKRIAEEHDYKEIVKEFLTSPAVKYIAGGLATALLTRLANNLSGKYPEISGFIRENMSHLEERLGEFKGGGFNRDLASRH